MRPQQVRQSWRDDEAEDRAIAKRARKAALRREDAERTREGRVTRWMDTSLMTEAGARLWGGALYGRQRRGYGVWDSRCHLAALYGTCPDDTHWRDRQEARRETGPNGLPWWVRGGALPKRRMGWLRRERARRPAILAMLRWEESFNPCLCQRLDIEGPGPHTRSCAAYPARCPSCGDREEAEHVEGPCACCGGIYEDARVSR